MILVITFLIFLNKPSLFIDDIEQITSEIINRNLSSDFSINISSIDGDFVSGFYARNTQVYLNNDLVACIDSVYLNPNISDLFLMDISFSNISLIHPKIYNFYPSQIISDNYNNANMKRSLLSQFPLDIIIDQFYIDNGMYQFGDQKYQFDGKLKCSYNKGEFNE